MDTVTIRQAINAAKQHEKNSGQLARLLDSRTSHLHRAIELPDEHVVPLLLNFITRYIEHVPEFVDAVDAIAAEAGLEEYTTPVITIAVEFFARPPELLSGHEGLNALMDEAYLAHRLIEEVNDRVLAASGFPLVPMDMTRSNLIIHHLIGEPFANQLDQAVHLIVGHIEYAEEILSSGALAQHLAGTRADWSQELKKWPCLTDSLSIQLALRCANPRLTLH